MTKDHNPQSVGDILKQAGQGSTGDLFANLLPHIQPVPQPLKPLSRVQNRLLEPCPEHDPEICFQHSVLCQTGLPYRDPGDDVRQWHANPGRRDAGRSGRAGFATPDRNCGRCRFTVGTQTTPHPCPSQCRSSPSRLTGDRRSKTAFRPSSNASAASTAAAKYGCSKTSYPPLQCGDSARHASWRPPHPNQYPRRYWL